jgi:DNA repair protein RecO (recombination protein O)
MERWTDQGIVLAVRPHGESGAVVSLLTEHNGRHAGYVPGGQSSKKRGALDPGNLVSAEWSARVSDGLGSYRLEQQTHLAARVMDDPLKLAALMSACALCDAALPEREGHPGLFHGLQALCEMMEGEAWGAAYVMWELALLRELGFGIDLSKCAVSGTTQDLIYVSPKSGRAVSAEKGEPYKDKLLMLPDFLRPGGGGGGDDADILRGLKLTGYFLEHWAFAQHTSGIPEQRLRFGERFARNIGDSTALEVIHGT